MTISSDLFQPTSEYTEQDLRDMYERFIRRKKDRGRSDEEAEFAAECFIRGFTGRTTYHLIPKEERFLKDDIGLSIV
jgi:hypothetical protein